MTLALVNLLERLQHLGYNIWKVSFHGERHRCLLDKVKSFIIYNHLYATRITSKIVQRSNMIVYVMWMNPTNLSRNEGIFGHKPGRNDRIVISRAPVRRLTIARSSRAARPQPANEIYLVASDRWLPVVPILIFVFMNTLDSTVKILLILSYNLNLNRYFDLCTCLESRIFLRRFLLKIRLQNCRIFHEQSYMCLLITYLLITYLLIYNYIINRLSIYYNLLRWESRLEEQSTDLPTRLQLRVAMRWCNRHTRHFSLRFLTRSYRQST